jgi:hypothetical protein
MCLTLQNSVLPLLRHPTIFLVLTAGRAAQRLQEVLFGEAADDVSASTIHRLLGYRNGELQKRLAIADLAQTIADQVRLIHVVQPSLHGAVMQRSCWCNNPFVHIGLACDIEHAETVGFMVLA